MPDSQGKFVGLGWTQRSADAWTRVFGNAAEQCCGDLGSGRPCEGCPAVPAEPSREVFSVRAAVLDLARLSEPLAGGVKMGDIPFTHGEGWDDAEEGRDPEEEADHQAARDGFNPEW